MIGYSGKTQRSGIVGVGPPSTSAVLQSRPSSRLRAGATRSRPFACIVERNTCVRSPGPDANITRSGGRKPSDWRALTLGIGTALVQRVLMEQPRPFDVDVAEAAFDS
jgi:hypothetical protein